jgi:hypothetical protein
MALLEDGLIYLCHLEDHERPVCSRAMRKFLAPWLIVPTINISGSEQNSLVSSDQSILFGKEHLLEVLLGYQFVLKGPEAEDADLREEIEAEIQKCQDEGQDKIIEESGDSEMREAFNTTDTKERKHRVLDASYMGYALALVWWMWQYLVWKIIGIFFEERKDARLVGSLVG